MSEILVAKFVTLFIMCWVAVDVLSEIEPLHFIFNQNVLISPLQDRAGVVIA